jgi:tetratricopeptide (TPR) repeat protein
VPGDRRWGSVARRGAREVGRPSDEPSASEAWREAAARSGRDVEAWVPEEVWVEEGPAEEVPSPRRQARRPASTGQGPASGAADNGAGTAHRHNVPGPVVDELTRSAGQQRGARLASRLADASHAYDRERYQEARRILRPLAEEVPDSPAVQELYGLALYRSGQWAAAASHLERYRLLTGEQDQNPVLADCYRALRRYGDAERLWDELRSASPSADLVAEGRIVAAGARADQGDLAGAVALLERSLRKVDRPQERHLRQWYALADLVERAGDLPRARTLFTRIAKADPDAFDVTDRLRALR